MGGRRRQRVADGWVAEFSIPLSVLRFPEAAVQTWGFSVRRQIAALNEEIESVDNPRTSNANVSRLGHLTGLEGLKPRRAVELVPYLATRGALRPQFSDPPRPTPRLLDPTLDVGLDVKAALTSDLALNATFNPDFGQVEADQLILNLSTFEAFFPEKRTFFTQGLELFQPVGSATGNVPQSLFYSRRIGLDTPILGAAKLTGTVTKGVEVGVLDAHRHRALAAAGRGAPGPALAPAPQPSAAPGPQQRAARQSAAPHQLPGRGGARLGGGELAGGRQLRVGHAPGGRRAPPEEAALDEEERPPGAWPAEAGRGAFDFDCKTSRQRVRSAGAGGREPRRWAGCPSARCRTARC